MTHTKKIVIIDDDSFSSFICNVLVRHICKPGLPDISEFNSSDEGLEYVEKWLMTEPQPLVLFLDIDMPGLSGWDVLNELNRLPAHAKAWLTVYLYTTYLSPLDEQRAIQHPLVKEVFMKPITDRIAWLRKELVETDALVSRVP